MITELLENYENFSDSLILEFKYKILDQNRTVEIFIKSMNVKKNFEYEILKLTLNQVVNFRFIENEKVQSIFINSALLKEENNLITLDFFPLIYSGNRLELNEKSDFKIIFKKIDYKVI